MLFNNGTVLGMESEAAQATTGAHTPNRGPAGRGNRRAEGRRVRDWCFTWNNYNEAEYALLRAIGESRGDYFQYLVFGREVGESGTPHLQGFVQFKRPITLSAVQRFLCPIARPGNHVHLGQRFAKPQEAADYCKKDGQFVEFGELQLGTGARSDLSGFVQRVKESGPLSMMEMMEEYPEIQARYPRWVEQVFDTYEPVAEVEQHPLREWQTDLAAMLDGEPDRRRVVFVTDYTGNAGKSWFIDWWCSSHSDSLVLHPSKHDNMAYVLSKTRPRPRTIFIDCPREKLEFFSYTFLEDLKNCRVLSNKYETKMVKLPKVPHVVVMMNSDPDRTKLSNDRFMHIVLDPMNQPMHYFPEE